ncbi:HTH-type transcriptional regulator BenM [Saezia sanguinis]|uniref:HTH-type transcriptional regulator BenM n=1 Tax=Saezia sanguinis TaxID=1965230 RepID=A0A433SDV4_9BURK|nr:LysR family transcriptional regulator [Saezia sanguinis]RUS66920.1 HTH-type transcriptional regulator BenM [Saezia sanguinis]
MSLKQLRYFCMVVEKGSFIKAANALNITQPPLSLGIKNLEEKLGSKLLNRGSHHVSVTASGAFVYQKSREIIELYDSMKSEIAKLEGASQSYFRVGYSPACQSFATDNLPLLHQEFPDICISAVMGDAGYLRNSLDKEYIDIAFLQEPSQLDSKYEIVPLPEIEFVALISNKYECSNKVITLQELSKMPLAVLLSASGDGFYHRLYDLFKRNNLPFRTAVESLDKYVLFDLILKNKDLVAILPAGELPERIKSNYTVAKLNHLGLVMRPCMMHLKTKDSSPVMNKFKQLITRKNKQLALAD